MAEHGGVVSGVIGISGARVGCRANRKSTLKENSV